MRKGQLLRPIAQHVGSLVAGQRGFDVDKGPGCCAFAESVVTDGANRAMPLAQTAALLATDAVDVDLDIDAHVSAALSNQIAEIPKGQTAILVGVAGNDVAAAAAHQLVNAQVFEVPAVGEVYEVAAVIGQSKQLPHQTI